MDSVCTIHFSGVSRVTTVLPRGACEALIFANSFLTPVLYAIRMPQFKKASINPITVFCQLPKLAETELPRKFDFDLHRLDSKELGRHSPLLGA